MGMDRDRGIERHLPLRPVEFHILLSLATGERHGYGIIRDIEARGESSPPDLGTMYRALARMTEAGLIEAATAARTTAAKSGGIITGSPDRHAGSPRGGTATGNDDAGGPRGRLAAEGGQMSNARWLNMSERWFRLLRVSTRPISATRWAMRWWRHTWTVPATRSKAAGRFRLMALWSARLIDSLRNGLAERAPGGLVAALRQLGPRYRTRHATVGALADIRRLDDRHTDDGARHVRLRPTRPSRRF